MTVILRKDTAEGSHNQHYENRTSWAEVVDIMIEQDAVPRKLLSYARRWRRRQYPAGMEFEKEDLRICYTREGSTTGTGWNTAPEKYHRQDGLYNEDLFKSK